MIPPRLSAILLALVLIHCATAEAGEPQADKPPLNANTLHNRVAYIPAQCYTRTQEGGGHVYNPCYTCHTKPRRPNFINDADLQLSYAFAAPALTNPWTNLFEDRRAAVAAISDEAMQRYIRTSNYVDADGQIIPAERLRQVPADWDYIGDGRWQGFVPDARFQFDDEGFDRDPQGRLTGWRAFGYYPFPSTFWPTNGSTGDVLIRLPEVFRTGLDGKPDLRVYKTNLAIVESLLKEIDIPIDPIEESQLGGVDLDKDGTIGTASRITYDWAPLKERFMWYVGRALKEQKAGRVHVAAGLFPEGTEFLQTVRYVHVDESGDNRLSPRMKELRYARKRRWVNYADLEQQAFAEVKEKVAFPDRLRTVRGNLELGVSNDQGWTYAGMIEDTQGELRPQTYEELVFCVGCHGGVGATRDGIFSFYRKFDPATAHRRGWYHWSQKGLRGTPERIRSDGKPEYAFYLKTNGAGDEYRGNDEVLESFFDPDGQLKPERLERLRTDIATLLFASPQRAMVLNKAYWTIVRDQGFLAGRDATLVPMIQVHPILRPDQATGVKEAVAGF